MFGGYYGPPMDTRSRIPGSMTFASGDTIATNSFVGDQIPFDSGEETTEKRRVDFDDELEVEASTPKAKRFPKRKQEEESEEDDSPAWLFGKNNAFFPIMFGGMGGSGRKSNEGYYPGSATAIANSFSTGKGGVATSHATSFGDPYMSTLFRNGNFNRKGARPALE